MRRIICLLLLAAILLAAPGCSPIIDGEYYVVTDHKDENGLGSADSDVIEVKTYQGIKTAILTFIKEGREQGVIKVSGYDGDVSEAISKASLEIITGTAIGAYAVEYITHSYSRIVSYYEANVFINYRRPQEQVKNVMYLNYVSAVQGALGTALNTHRDYLVISISSELVTPEYIKNYILEYYRENPQSVIAPPEAEITVYEGEQLPKILEIELSYPYTAEQSAEMRKALGLRAQKLLEGAQAPSDEYTALNICSALISVVEYSPEGPGSAYGTIMEGVGNSEGFAMAYKLLCSMLGVKCMVVEGELNGEKHYWNIIGLGGYYYHVDPSVCRQNGIESAFLRSDYYMERSYTWDVSAYKVCDGPLTYDKLVSENQR